LIAQNKARRGKLELNTGIIATVVGAVVSPVATALVTTAGIALQRRRSDRDLEARRLRLIEAARNQIQAVEPVWNSTEKNNASTPDDTRERAYTIIISALDSILRAQALSQPQHHQRRSILSDLLLFRHFQTRAARILRALYYMSFAWTTFFFYSALEGVFDRTVDVSTKIVAIGFLGVVALVPVLVFRSAAVSHEHRYENDHPPAALSQDGWDNGPPPGPQYPFPRAPIQPTFISPTLARSSTPTPTA
jgi:hypothetical protein